MLQYYSILGLQPNCTQDDIKKAFHRLAHIHHPDKGGSEENFKKINEAYQYLQQHHPKSHAMQNVPRTNEQMCDIFQFHFSSSGHGYTVNLEQLKKDIDTLNNWIKNRI